MQAVLGFTIKLTYSVLVGMHMAIIGIVGAIMTREVSGSDPNMIFLALLLVMIGISFVSILITNFEDKSGIVVIYLTTHVISMVFAYLAHTQIQTYLSGVLVFCMLGLICNFCLLGFSYTLVTSCTKYNSVWNSIPVPEESIDCVICLETIEQEACEIRVCKHVFHRNCIVGWLSKQNTCPICRSHL